VLRKLESAFSVELYEGPSPISSEHLKQRLAGRRALISVLTDRVSADVLDAGTDLAIVANIAVGYDNIDVAHAKRRGVVVTNTPDVLTNAVAEFTWALILSAARRVAEADRLIRRGGWKGWALDFMLGSELTGKQLGIIGRGRIGTAVAAKAPAFGMKAVFAGRQGPGAIAQSAKEGLPAIAQSAKEGPSRSDEVSLDELLIGSDVISIHVPQTPATTKMIGRRELARMKRSAILVNTARGAVVDEEALGWALSERLIAGAALDVFENEPTVHPTLLAMENVVLAPHLGSATRETRTAMADLAVSNVIAVLSGEAPLTPV
jgi:glyoxylate reductase